MAFWNNTSGFVKVTQLPLPSHNVYHQFGPAPNIGVVAFDPHQELLWIGDNFVRSLLTSQLIIAFAWLT